MARSDHNSSGAHDAQPRSPPGVADCTRRACTLSCCLSPTIGLFTFWICNDDWCPACCTCVHATCPRTAWGLVGGLSWQKHGAATQGDPWPVQTACAKGLLCQRHGASSLQPDVRAVLLTALDVARGMASLHARKPRAAAATLLLSL